jgi:hypothetical protein
MDKALVHTGLPDPDTALRDIQVLEDVHGSGAGQGGRG